MEKIKFYKLISPYPEDITMNCKLTMADIDENFLAFKDNDIKTAIYDPQHMLIQIVRNNGEKINIDLSSISGLIDDKISNALSGQTTSGGCCCDIDLTGSLDENGVLTLSWTTEEGRESTQISGFLSNTDVRHDETLSGGWNEYNPLRLANNEKTGRYKGLLGITEDLPHYKIGYDSGKRWLTKGNFHVFGRLYTETALSIISSELERLRSQWRIPSLEDWMKLINYAEICVSATTNQSEDYLDYHYVGDIAGAVLKKTDFWVGNICYDNFRFGALPAGFVVNGDLFGVDTDARFWTSTVVDGNQQIVGFNAYRDDALIENAGENGLYSIRLVADIDDNSIGDTVNIFGNTYDVINLKEIGQAWITINLNYNPGDNYTEQFDYDLDGTIYERYIINHWNGDVWETKELNPGDEISIISENRSDTYICVLDADNNQHLVKSGIYGLFNGEWRMLIDGGSY